MPGKRTFSSRKQTIPAAIQSDLSERDTPKAVNTQQVPVQTKARISESTDSSEQKANIVADQLLNIPLKDIGNISPVNTINHKEKNHNAGSSVPSIVENTLGDGRSIDDNARSMMESRFQYDFEHVKIHDNDMAAKSADSINALAYTSGSHIVFNAGQYNVNSESGKKLLAHELTHVVQQESGNMNDTKINRQPAGSPYDKALVERAKARLKILKPKLDVLRSYKTQIDIEKLHAANDRRELDVDHTNPKKQITRFDHEEANFPNVNTGAVEIYVTGDTILFKIKFQMFFQDPKAKRPELLKKTLQGGINLIWNQTFAGGGIFQGRVFKILPDTELIDSLGDRKSDHWLIEVRDTNNGPVVHPGCKFPQPPAGLPTSVTLADCDNGVMNIPPAHLTNAGVIGHEMLHLFGLFDRYLMLSTVNKGKVTAVDLVPVRELGGRKDPLGGENATIISEDLKYLFLKLGVYNQEELRSTSILPLLEREVDKLERIVQFGYDPDSLLPIRKDFRDKILDSANELD